MKRSPKKSINVFKRFFSDNPANHQGLQEDKTISACMSQLFHVLESGYTSEPEMQSFIHFAAILGATGRLIEALLNSKESKFQNIFNKGFLLGVRNSIYHAQGPFCELCSFLDPKILTFFSHIYEHCRHELGSVQDAPNYPPLSRSINLIDRKKDYFINAIDYAMHGKQIRTSKVKDKSLARLERNVVLLNDLVQFLQDNPEFLVDRNSPETLNRSNIVRGNAVATQIAWIGLDTSSLLKSDFYLNEADEAPSQLTKKEQSIIVKKYQEYIDPGIRYRHDNGSLSKFLKKYNIAAKITDNHPSIQRNELRNRDLLFVFAKLGNIPHVEYFFGQLTTDKNDACTRALIAAAANGKSEIVLWFLEESGVIFTSEILLLATREAAKSRQLNVIQLLVEKAGFDFEGQYECPESWDCTKPAEMLLLLRNLRISEQSPNNYVPIYMPHSNDEIDLVSDKVRNMKL